MRKSQYEMDPASLWDDIDVTCIPETILNGIEGEIIGFKTDFGAVTEIPESLFSKTQNMEQIEFHNHSAMFALPENFLSNLPKLTSLNLIGSSIEPCTGLAGTTNGTTNETTPSFFSNSNVCYQSDTNCYGTGNITQQVHLTYKNNDSTEDCVCSAKDACVPTPFDTTVPDYSNCEISVLSLNDTSLEAEIGSLLTFGLESGVDSNSTGYSLTFDAVFDETRAVKISVLRATEASIYYSVHVSYQDAESSDTEIVISSSLIGFVGSDNVATSAVTVLAMLEEKIASFEVENLVKRRHDNECSFV